VIRAGVTRGAAKRATGPAAREAPDRAGVTRSRSASRRSTPLLLARAGDARGQVAVLLVGGLLAIGVGALVLGAVARGLETRDAAQHAADLAALAGARGMRESYDRLFEPARLGGRPNPRHLGKDAYVAIGRAAAVRTAAANGVPRPAVSFPDGATFAPVRVRVAVERGVRIAGQTVRMHAVAEAELAPPAGVGPAAFASGGGYDGALAYRQGKPMRPDVARAFDRMSAAARRDGVHLVISSAFRSDAEQAILFARHPDPKWVAPPGESLHRNATELDLGPPSAYPWLAANAGRFHFLMRYAWEPWHWGFTLSPRSTPRPAGATPAKAAGDRARPGLPDFVPARYAPALNRAAQRWSVSATLLAAQIYAESGFNPFAVSPAGAQGIAQFMPGTARGMGLDDPFDPDQAIDAQAHLMRDLLRQFGAVPLALAAYNAGPAPVSACGCVPPYPETRGYVARILGLMNGAGEPGAAGDGAGLTVRLVR
jgi:Transglycosylase SLT domain/D-alanyl-D-alanine carboxypeptidase/Putative Flp pilus-assembly TadE/G-like